MDQIDDHYTEACKTPSDINEHLPVLKEFAEGCKHITEMGVRSVVSTWAFLAGRPKTLRSYDIEYHPNMRAALTAAYETDIDLQFIIADTTKTNIEPTEFLFIDTYHVYEQLKAELARHKGKVSKFIGFHDTTVFETSGEDEGSKGLMPAINEFLADNPEWQIALRLSNNNGLTVLRK